MSDAPDESPGFSSLQSVFEGAGIFMIGRVFREIIKFVTNLILTRTLGTNLYGLYAYLFVLSTFFQRFTELGASNSIFRFIPKYEDEPNNQHQFLTLAYTTSLIASAVGAGIVYYSAPSISAFTLDDPQFVKVLRVGAFVLPFSTLSKITFSTFKSIGRMDYNVLTSSVAQPLFRLVFVGGAILLGTSVVGASMGLVVAGAFTVVISILVLRSQTTLGTVRAPTTDRIREYYDFSLPVMFTNIGGFLYNRVDILMVGVFLSGAAVGIYNVAVALSGILAMSLTAFNQLFPPMASRLYHDDRMGELTDLYKTVTRWVFTISLFPGIALILYADSILFVFGDNFTRGSTVLILSTVAQLTFCAVGPSGYLLTMTDHQYLAMTNQLLSGAVNVVLNYVLILQFGLIGAAMATATVLATINVARVFQVFYLEGVHPYSRKFLKPILAGAIVAVVMYVLSMVFDRYALLVVGGGLGALSYAGVLYAIGIEQEDREMVDRLVSARTQP